MIYHKIMKNATNRQNHLLNNNIDTVHFRSNVRNLRHLFSTIIKRLINSKKEKGKPEFEHN